MNQTEKTNGFYCFDGIVVDSAAFRVEVRGEARSLTPRAFDLLRYLIEQRGRVVEKQELFDRVWQEAFVTDQALAREISEIRRVLGDEATAPRYVKTVHKRGYQFIAELQEPERQTPEAESPPVAEVAAPAVREISPANTEPVRPAPASDRGKSAVSRSRRWAVAGALALLVLATLAGWFYLRSPSKLTNKDTILLADLVNQTGEVVFDGVLKEGLAMQLQQSPFLSILPEAQMRREMRLMKREPQEKVTAELAREICQRLNLKASVAGSIAALGSHYAITLTAVTAESGETLAREQVEAESKEQVLQALSQAATRLRERLGESLSSIQQFDRPLQECTTSNLEAFKAYTQGVELAASGRTKESIPFYQRAVELDPDFAQAYSQLAIMTQDGNQSDQAIAYATRAFALRGRAGELEKFRITHTYHRLVTWDLHKAVDVLRLQRAAYPREWTGPNVLASVYNHLGQSEAALIEAREALRLNPNFVAPYNHLALALLRLNRFAEAKEALEQARQRGLAHRSASLLLYQLAFLDHDVPGMQQQIEARLGKPVEYLALDWQSQAAAFAGQEHSAQELARRAIDLALSDGAQELAARYIIEQALRNAVFGNCQQASTAALQGLKLSRSRVPLMRAALGLALCGQAQQAKLLTEELRQRYPADTLSNELWLPLIHAALALQQGDAAQAVEQLQATVRYEPAAEFWPQYLRGQAYLKLGRGSDAAAEFQRILDHRGYGPLSPFYPLAQLGLARAAASAGDAARSRQAYDDFFAAWKEADADLPALRAAKKEFH